MGELPLSDMERKFHYWLEHGTLIYASYLQNKTSIKSWGRVKTYEVLESGDVSFVLYNDETGESVSILLSLLEDFQAEEEPDVQYVTYYPGHGSLVVSAVEGSGTDSRSSAAAAPAESRQTAGEEVTADARAAAEAPAQAADVVPQSSADELLKLLPALSESDLELLLSLAERLARR